MWRISEFDVRCSVNQKTRNPRIRRWLRLLYGLAILSTLPLAAGCSPELLVGGAIVGSVLYAHVNKDNLPSRRESVLHEPRTYYASGGRAARTYTASRPPRPGAESPWQDEKATVSPIVKGARAYRELRWEEAARILAGAIDSGQCTGSELGQAHTLLGAIAYQQGDSATAKRHFAEAHRRDRQLRPSPDLFPPQLIDFYKGASGP